MNVYELCLITHLLGMLGIAVGLAYEWLLFQNALGPANEVRQWIRATRILAPIVLISSLLAGGTGVYLAVMMRAWPEGWIRASMGALIFMIAMGILIAPRTRHLRRLEARGETDRLRPLLLHPMLQTPLRVRIAVFVSIIFLMVVRSAVGPSLEAVGIAVALGLLWSAPTWRSGSLQAAQAQNQ